MDQAGPGEYQGGCNDYNDCENQRELWVIIMGVLLQTVPMPHERHMVWKALLGGIAYFKHKPGEIPADGSNSRRIRILKVYLEAIVCLKVLF